MSFIKNVYVYAKTNNLLFGIVIIDLVSFISYFLSGGVSILITGDIQLLFGVILGVWFALKFLHNKKKSIILGILVGSIGAVLSALSLAIFQWTFAQSVIIDIVIIYLYPAVIIGPIAGLAVGMVYYLKDKTKSEPIDDSDEFYKSLEEK
ncbi:MAG: hypothetical protein GF317_24730 [Candidatus Lokiarchaeota archaeon]|nr:hypothetical protein [Candidatus Lokiarchaeota archaeon]MBD3202567.1 hypothetical protein [Candidatus Lokiarchaeota archaeon]